MAGNIRLVNLTPHNIAVVGEAGEVILTIPRLGMVARCATIREVVGRLDMEGVAIPITSTKFGQVYGLPPQEEGTLYIVSALVAQAARDRHDLLVPDDMIRDSEGWVIGCRGFSVVAEGR